MMNSKPKPEEWL